MIIWFYKERMIFQDIDQKILCGINYDHHTFSIQPCHDLFIHVIRHRRWNAACQEKYIAFSKLFQFLHQFLYFILADHRSCTIDLGSVNRFQFQIDP